LGCSLTINKVCGSGLKAVMLASQAIKAGDAQCVVAGGQEAMSASPHYVYGLRNGIKAGNQTMVDGMIHDGLWDSFGNNHMGAYAEYTASKAGVTRQDQDHRVREPSEGNRRAGRGVQGGNLPVQVSGKAGAVTMVADEGPQRTRAWRRSGSSSRRSEGRHRDAGNAPGLNDGAARCSSPRLHSPKRTGSRVAVTGYSTGGRPRRSSHRHAAQSHGTRRHHDRRLRPDRGQQAFAVQALADERELGWDWDRVNGTAARSRPSDRQRCPGAHDPPMPCATGAADRLATLCLGGGNAVVLSGDALMNDGRRRAGTGGRFNWLDDGRSRWAQRLVVAATTQVTVSVPLGQCR
jgi:acetyl-CoA C-acetyltransferase